MSASNETHDTHAAPNKIRQGRKPTSVPQQGAIKAMATRSRLPLAAATECDEHDEIGGGNVSGGALASMSVITTESLPGAANTDTIAALSALQRQRRFCIVSQSRSDRACEAFIARYLGYRPDMPKAEGLAVWKQAAAIRKAVEKGGGGQSGLVDQKGYALAACTPIILNSATARKAWDAHRNQTEKAMRKLARSLHVWPWVEGVAGFGDLGLGIIIGETGDLANYATKERVWKRLGLAVIDGERQQRKSGAETAAAHGYNPKRRAEVWAIVDSMFKHQWRGAKEDTPAQSCGPYGAIYGQRKAHTVTREWTPKHRDNDARRIMAKALIEDVWRVWRGLPPLLKANP